MASRRLNATSDWPREELHSSPPAWHRRSARSPWPNLCSYRDQLDIKTLMPHEWEERRAGRRRLPNEPTRGHCSSCRNLSSSATTYQPVAGSYPFKAFATGGLTSAGYGNRSRIRLIKTPTLRVGSHPEGRTKCVEWEQVTRHDWY